jgi:hypothetical protein
VLALSAVGLCVGCGGAVHSLVSSLGGLARKKSLRCLANVGLRGLFLFRYGFRRRMAGEGHCVFVLEGGGGLAGLWSDRFDFFSGSVRSWAGVDNLALLIVFLLHVHVEIIIL